MKYFLYLFLFLYIPVSGPAQPIPWQANKMHYNNTNNGIPNVIYALHKDKKGYIWMGTKQGLLRYDGSRFKLYTTEQGLPDNEVFAIIEDNDERLWLVTYNANISYIKNNNLFCNANSSFIRRINLRNKNKTYLHATALNADNSILFYHHPADSIIEVKGADSYRIPPPAYPLSTTETFWAYVKYRDTYGMVTSKGIVIFNRSGKVLKHIPMPVNRFIMGQHLNQSIFLTNGKLLNADLKPISFRNKQQFNNHHYTIPCYVNGVLKIATPSGLYEANGGSDYNFLQPTAAIAGALNDTWTSTLESGIYNQLNDAFSYPKKFRASTTYYMFPDHLLTTTQPVKMGNYHYTLGKYQVNLQSKNRSAVAFNDSTNKIISVTCDHNREQLLVCGLKYAYRVKNHQAFKIDTLHDFKRIIAMGTGYLAMDNKALHYLDSSFSLKASWSRTNLLNILNVNDSLCLIVNRNYLELVLLKDKKLVPKGIFKSNFITSPILSASLHRDELQLQTEHTIYKFLWTGITAYPIRLDADRLTINSKITTGKNITLPYGKHYLADLGLSHVDHVYGDCQYEYMLYTEGEYQPGWITSSKEQITLLFNNHGNYTLKVRARSSNNTYSNILTYHFTIPIPFWLHPFFLVGVTILISGMIYYTIYSIQKKKKERLLNEKELELRFFQSELRSLNALMNPHFAFNALNSIQFLINDQQNDAAQKYLSTFAGLLRRNLHNLENEFISLEDEIALIESYLKLEQMRMKDNFSYYIACEPGIDLSRILVPPLLVQPLVENAVLHGVSRYSNKEGIIKIVFTSTENNFCISVMDNGAASPELDLQKSFGLKNITDRMRQISSRYHKKYALSITERFPEEGISWTRLDIILER